MKKEQLTIKIPKEIKWEFKEPKKYYSTKWYVLVSLFFATLVLIGIFILKSWTSVCLFVIVFMAMMIYTKRPTGKVNFLLNEQGIFVNEQLYKIKSYQAFYIKQTREYFNIHLVPKNKIGTELILSFEEKTGENLVDFLSQYLKMEQYEDTLIDNIVKMIGL